MIRAAIILSVALATTLVRDLRAQMAPSRFVQASVGLGNSAGGNFVERDEYTVDVMLGQPLRTRVGGTLIGIAAGKSFVNGSDLTCQVLSTGGCVPQMPRLGHAGVLIGIERSAAVGSMSFLAGPGVAGEELSRAHAALLFRADYATPAVQHLSLALSGRGVAVSSGAGSMVVLRSFTVGVRVR